MTDTNSKQIIADDAATDETAAAVITPDIPLGVGGGKILLSCETGVYQFVKSLAEDRGNHLPNKMTGVLMKYLTEGIERDFGRTWDRTPNSIEVLRETSYTAPKVKAPSKKYKNELIAKSAYDYYANDVEEGTLTREEATAKMFAAIDEIKELEEAGFVISKNKTAGVKRFDAVAEVNKNYDGDKDYHLIYKLNDLEIVVPNLGEYGKERVSGNKKRTFETQLNKCGALKETLAHNKPLTEYIDSNLGNSVSEWMKENERITHHLVKSKIIGQQKPRYICYEGINKKTQKQSLLVVDVSMPLTAGHTGGTGGFVREIDE
jgi:hypothetical protein